MQLVLPLTKNLALYSWLFDDQIDTTITSPDQMLSLLRNARATVDTIQGNNATLNPLMGALNGGITLTRITNLGVQPDISSYQAFATTLFPTSVGFNVNGRCNGRNEQHHVSDTDESPFTFSSSSKSYTPGVASFCPTQVGGNPVPVSSYYISGFSAGVYRVFGGSSSGVMYNLRYRYVANQQSVSEVKQVAQHDSTEYSVTKFMDMSFAQNTSVLLEWAKELYGSGRWNTPVRSTGTPLVPTASASLTGESSISLAKGIIGVSFPDRLVVIHIKADEDFSFPAGAPRASIQGTINQIQLHDKDRWAL